MYPLALIVENAGSSFDQEIQVNLDFPDSLKILTSASISLPNDLDALDVLIDTRFARKILGISADSLVAEYNYGPFIDLDVSGDYDFVLQMQSSGKRLQAKKSKFLHQLEHIMDFEVYSDIPGFTQLRFYFKQINPNIKLAFPCFILLNAEEDFTIDYQITTKHSSVVHEGKLHCVISNDSQQA